MAGIAYSLTAICDRCGAKSDAPVSIQAETITARKTLISVSCGDRRGEICDLCYSEYQAALKEAESTFKTAYTTSLDKFTTAKATAQTQYNNTLNAFWGDTGNEITRER